MILNETDFGPVFLAAGSRNFFGQGWKQHKPLKLFPGFDLSGATLVTKTATLESRMGLAQGEEGNMSLRKSDLESIEFFPDCVVYKPIKGIILNAIGLTGPGLDNLIKRGLWQKMTAPFILSIMAVRKTTSERMVEIAWMAWLIRQMLQVNKSMTAAVELNVSCPNAEHNPKELEREAIYQLRILKAGLAGCFYGLFDDLTSPQEIFSSKDPGRMCFILKEAKLREDDFRKGVIPKRGDTPVGIKLNVLIQPESTLKISYYCDYLSVSNTIPWGQLPHLIKWKKLFGSNVSPLVRYGGGGLSGWPLLFSVSDWLLKTRDIGVKKPIKAGGGIMRRWDVDLLHLAGASAVEIGSVIPLRPWRVRSIIQRARELFAEGG